MSKAKVIKKGDSQKKETPEVISTVIDLRMKKKRILTPEGAAEYFRKLFAMQLKDKWYEKVLWVIGIDEQNKPLYAEFVCKFNDRPDVIHQGDKFKLFRNAILNNADRLIVGHNRPFKDIIPWSEDFRLDDRLTRAGYEIGIPVIDYIIIAYGKKQKFYSMLRGLGKDEHSELSSVRCYYWNSGKARYPYQEKNPAYA
jgi:DNA repair protein RadC